MSDNPRFKCDECGEDKPIDERREFHTGEMKKIAQKTKARTYFPEKEYVLPVTTAYPHDGPAVTLPWPLPGLEARAEEMHRRIGRVVGAKGGNRTPMV